MVLRNKHLGGRPAVRNLIRQQPHHKETKDIRTARFRPHICSLFFHWKCNWKLPVIMSCCYSRNIKHSIRKGSSYFSTNRWRMPKTSCWAHSSIPAPAVSIFLFINWTGVTKFCYFCSVQKRNTPGSIQRNISFLVFLPFYFILLFFKMQTIDLLWRALFKNFPLLSFWSF